MIETSPSDLASMALRIKTLITVFDTSNAEFARKIDVTPQNVNEWLRGNNRPSIDVAYRIHKYTGVPVEWIWWGGLEWAIPYETRRKLEELLKQASVTAGKTGT